MSARKTILLLLLAVVLLASCSRCAALTRGSHRQHSSRRFRRTEYVSVPDALVKISKEILDPSPVSSALISSKAVTTTTTSNNNNHYTENNSCERARDCIEGGGFYKGQWKWTRRDRSETHYTVDNWYNEAEKRFRRTNNDRLVDLDWNCYDWVPENKCCDFTPFTLKDMCSTFQRHNISNILFWGDSLTESFFSTLVGLMKANKTIAQHEYYRACADEKGGYTLTIRLAFSSYFDLDGHDWNEERKAKAKYPYDVWKAKNMENLDIFTTHIPSTDLLIMNSGAWFYNVTLFESKMLRMSSFLRANYSGRIIYRTTPSGHPGCENYTSPFKTLRPPLELARDKYGWNKFATFDNIAVSIFSQLPRFHLLDVVPMTSLRGDGHADPPKDCLHYHLPGVVDWWTFLLQQELNAMNAFPSKGSHRQHSSHKLRRIEAIRQQRKVSVSDEFVKIAKEVFDPSPDSSALISSKAVTTTTTSNNNNNNNTDNNNNHPCERARDCIEGGGFNRGNWFMNHGHRPFSPQPTIEEQVMSWTSYDWHPKDQECCGFKPWTVEAMCSTLSRHGIKKLILIGDSMTHQLSDALVHSMDAQDKDPSIPDPYLRYYLACKKNESEREGVYIRFIPSPFLKLDHNKVRPNKDKVWENREVVSIDQLHEYIPTADLVIINTGCWWGPVDGPVDGWEFKNTVQHFVDFLRATYSGPVIYRTTNRGHFNCSNNLKPFVDAAPPLDPATDKYGWRKLVNLDNMAVHIFSQLPRFHLLDIVPMTNQRGDGHKDPPNDCLHYKFEGIGGPVYWWVYLLYQHLDAIATL